MDRPSRDLDPVDSSRPEFDAVVKLPRPRPDDVSGLGQAEWQEQQSGLVDMVTRLVDDGDRDILAVFTPEPVGGQRATGAGADYHYVFAHRLIMPVRPINP